MWTAPLVVIACRDAATRTMLRFLLVDDGCDVVEVCDVATVATMPRRENIALLAIVNDSKEDSGATMATLHRCGVRLPTVLLMHGRDRQVRRRGFGLGVRDVVSLPASPRDIQARLRAVLHDTAPHAREHAASAAIRAGGLVFWTAIREVDDGTGWHARLTQHEAALLRALMLAPGQVIERQILLDRAWSESYEGIGNVLEVNIRRLRAKLAASTAASGSVRTIRGRGYTFDARTAARHESTPPHDGPLRVLVVEDDQPTAQLVDAALRDEGYAVTLTSGAEAPALARRLQPALILLDITMPDMDGVEVRWRLRAEPRTAHIPVIATSTRSNLRARLDEMGADDFLAKPFDIDELVLRVMKWAGRPDRTHATASPLAPLIGHVSLDRA